MENFQTTTLTNGLKVIFEPSSTGVAYCGYVVYAGTRNENPDEEGMAHFIEHVSFKGTERRNSWHINNALESVGGDLNAYTGKEETVYYTAIPKGELPRAIDVLSDMVFHSRYPQREIDKEVEVISDEIESYNDNPAELIFDEFEELLFKDHPLGRNILGNAARLKTYTTADAVNFTQRFYRPANCTFYVYADAEFARIVKLLEKATSGLDSAPAVKQEAALPPYEAREVVHDKKTHQAHVIVGSRAFSATDKRRTAFFLLNNILGGPGMNSLLNVAIRERRGYAYTVESSLSLLSDCGLFTVYFGSDAHHVAPSLRIIADTIDRLASSPLSDRALDAAKKQFVGQLLVASDSRESQIIAAAKSMMYFNRIGSKEETAAHINAVTADEIMSAAQLLLADSASTLTLQ